MKKILLSILTVLLLALGAVIVMNGMDLFGLEIIGINGIQEKNSTLDATIDNATKLASTDYENALESIKNDLKKLKEEKKTYEDLVSVNEQNETGIAAQYQKYEIEYLWAIVGNHATSEGVELKMDLVSGVQTNVYNLNFTIRGNYIGIIDFISSLESDPVLGFKIENFNLVPAGSTDQLQATFTCKSIQITLSQKDSSNSTGVNSTTTQSSSNSIEKIEQSFSDATEQTKKANQTANEMLSDY